MAARINITGMESPTPLAEIKKNDRGQNNSERGQRDSI
jgi:hypothetical protein